MRIALMLLLVLLSGGIRAAQAPLALVGEATLEVFVWPVYHSRLFAPSGEYHPQARPLRLEITYLRDVEAQQLVDRTRREWRHLNLEHPHREQWLETLATLLPDVKTSDTLALSLNPDNSSQFYFNGKLLGRVDDKAFGEQFLAIWLSPETSQPELRGSLLGANSD